MIPLKRFSLMCLTSLLLLNPAHIIASAPDRINQLVTERENLKSETQEIKEEVQAAQNKIEQLKRRIKFFHIRNRQLDKHILEEIQHYKNKIGTTSNNETEIKK